jgi:catechol 2,3-dioxygenase-like lactoylglutathione lyase family enzyme
MQHHENARGLMILNQVTLPALNVAVSVEFYCRMGFQLVVDAPHYARFKCPEGDASFSVHLVEAPLAPSAVVVYFETRHLDERVKALKQRGFTFSQEPRDEPWLWREARLLDPSENVLCLYWAGTNRLDPPWRVRRPE